MQWVSWYEQFVVISGLHATANKHTPQIGKLQILHLWTEQGFIFHIMQILELASHGAHAQSTFKGKLFFGSVNPLCKITAQFGASRNESLTPS